MQSLLRNPFLRLVGRLWWLPALLLTCAWALLGPAGLQAAALILLALGAFVGSAAVAALSHGSRAALAERSRHKEAAHQFLCPSCLCLAPIAYSCAACGKEVDAFQVQTRGAYLLECPHCHVPLFGDAGAAGAGIRAFCRACSASSDRSVHHERSIRLIAVLTEGDRDALCARAAGLEWIAAEEGALAFADDGACLTCVIVSGALPDGSLSRNHALRAADIIWTTCGDDPLLLGQTLDRLLRQRDSPGHSKLPRFCCAATLDAGARNAVGGRLPIVEENFTAETLLSIQTGSRQTALPRVERVLAAVTAEDHSELRAARDGGGRRILLPNSTAQDEPGGAPSQ